MSALITPIASIPLILSIIFGALDMHTKFLVLTEKK